MKFYTYRLKEKPKEFASFPIQEVPVILEDDDKFLVFLSGDLIVLGIYHKEKDKLILEKKLKGKLSDYYKYISSVETVGERTYKMFAKPVREIDISDFEKIKNL